MGQSAEICTQQHKMENSVAVDVRRFVAEQENLTEQRLGMVNTLKPDESSNNTLPSHSHVTETFDLLRQNAKEDLSNNMHIQSTFPSSLSKEPSGQTDSSSSSKLNLKQSRVKTVQAVFGETGEVLGQVEEDVEAAIDVTDYIFTLEDVDSSTNGQLRSHQSVFSDEDRDNSELAEGIQIPSKFRKKKPEEVAASLPVQIQSPAQMNSAYVADGGVTEASETPRDIAASIQAMAYNVHTSSIFGDNIFGELPRPRLNTHGKE